MPRWNPQIVFNTAYAYSQPYANKFGVDASLMAIYLTAIAKKESNFNTSAKNKNSSARGIMQILNCTQRAIEKRLGLPFQPMNGKCNTLRGGINVPLALDKLMNDPNYSIMLAANELAYQYKRYKDWGKAIHAYNQGSYSGKADGEKYKNNVLALANNFQNLKPDNDLASVMIINDGTSFYSYEVFI